ncbi:dihydrolipoyl dehydrogenase [Brevundimonas sp.]|jgi:dihydrolipoamide dehydrogenase|uniref:dihydrolipoyl dehydrogenase n=1 Tax=Brevundimonas sp. TaxID=1871086 RepID=UPI0025BFAA3E|nr:dihydrolipoyl dehydrogenase [Brevundimonas sp.]
MPNYDIVIIGGGPGGYPAAIRASQLGFKVAVVEERDLLGGTCLNIGCIPSKALLQSTERLVAARGLAAYGILADNVRADLPGVMAHKTQVVDELGAGVAWLFKKNDITWLKGRGKLVAAGRVEITGPGGAVQEAVADRGVIIATGSKPSTLPGVPIDERRIVSSAGALSLPEVPKRLAVIGGGYVGLELGSVWRRLGSEVVVIEFMDRIAAGLDAEMADALQKVLEKQGIEFRLQSKVTGCRQSDDSVVLELVPSGGSDTIELEADYVLVSIGRRAASGFGLEEIGGQVDDKGRVAVNARYETNIPGVYAIGDVIGGAMLAHKAEEEGIAVAELLAGRAGHVNYEAIPAVVYTWPELASVGKTEEELKSAGVAYRVGRFPFSANAMAKARLEREGFVKVLADSGTDKILGVHILGPDAGTMIHEAVLALEFGAAAEDIARTSHAHPTLPEALREACLAVDRRTINL